MGRPVSTVRNTRRCPKRATTPPSKSAIVTAPTPCAVTSAAVPDSPEWNTFNATAGTSAMNGAASSEFSER